LARTRNSSQVESKSESEYKRKSNSKSECKSGSTNEGKSESESENKRESELLGELGIYTKGMYVCIYAGVMHTCILLYLGGFAVWW